MGGVPTSSDGSYARRRVSAASAKDDDPADPTPTGLLSAAGLLKAVYNWERSHWSSVREGHPVVYVSPKKYDGVAALTVDGELTVEPAHPSVWVSLATFVEQLKAPPGCYVSLQFLLLTREENAPEPLQLRAPKYERRWQENWGKLPDRLRLSLLVQKGVAERQFAGIRSVGRDPEDVWAFVLLDEGIELSALFRCCVAAQLGSDRFDRIAERYEAEAILQFGRFPAQYRKAWGAFIPRGFALRARRVYPYLLTL